jgi:starch phosphorylase
VLPRLPERLSSLSQLAYNLWWCWNADAVALFRRIDPELFHKLDHSPIRLLGGIQQARIDALAKDDGFLAHLDRVNKSFTDYMNAPTWFSENHGRNTNLRIAYFSAEFGINESVPVYSGGLGVLAGDHLKSASDLGMPLMGVSLMYREGYFRQYLNIDGWQQERYPENDFFTLPLIEEHDNNGNTLIIKVPFPGREVAARVWRIQVGRVPLYLLDCNIPQNSPEDRAITAQLYGGDLNTRIQQEIVLGIGGLRALRALGKEPTVCHMNEGHAAFVGLERIRQKVQENGHDFATALEAVKAGTCFTTHTPVPAGNDAFPAGMIDYYFSNFMQELKIDRQTFLNLGREHPNNESENFSMTVLAIRLSNTSNGVSKLHGEVSRKMWRNLWPNLPEVEVPIDSITNGVHTQTWVAPEIGALFDRYLGSSWEEKPHSQEVWNRVEAIPDAELWRTHERCRERLVAMARQRLVAQLKQRGSPPSEIAAAEEVLDPDALTIGFARRFATYKRGTLIFRDLERLLHILNLPNQPVQFIFSGKAHPKDQGGKELIAQVVQYARRAEFRRKIVFLEDYDMNVARHLIQGVDVWMNNPRRPLEASGTSGMKVCVNGGVNLSILDGWWVEGYLGDNGFAIGSGEEYSDTNYQDNIESRSLYDLIEHEIVPEFYTRGSDGLPRQWIRRMKKSIATNVPVFNTHRMVMEYAQKCYLPSYARFETLSKNNLSAAKELATWRQRVSQNWHQIRVEDVTLPSNTPMRVGDEFPVKAKIYLGDLSALDVEVQLVHGNLDSFGEIVNPKTAVLTPTGSLHDGRMNEFGGVIRCELAGNYGFSVRVLPKHMNLPHVYEPGLVTWG